MNARLMLGDCLDLMGRIEPASVDLILADLPYGKTRCKWDSVIAFEPLWKHYRRILKPRGAVVLTASQPFTSALVMSNPKWFRYELVWNKVQGTGHLNAKRRPLSVCESVLIFSEKQTTYNPQLTTGKPIKRTAGGIKKREGYGDFLSLGTDSGTTRQPTTLLTISAGRSPHNRTVHPTQKPVALMEYLALTYSNPGEVILDNAMGSGTTGVAAVRTGRRFVGMELDPEFFAVAQDRIAAAERELAA